MSHSAAPRTVAHQAPVHAILQASTREWVAIPFSGDLPNPGIKPRSPALQVDSLPSEQFSCQTPEAPRTARLAAQRPHTQLPPNNQSSLPSHSTLKLNRNTHQRVLPTEQEQCGTRRDQSVISWVKTVTLSACP